MMCVYLTAGSLPQKCFMNGCEATDHASKRSKRGTMAMESRDGAVVRALASHQCGPGSISKLGVTCGLSLLLVLVLAPRGFSQGTPVFLFP